jgi:Zn-dependent protease
MDFTSSLILIRVPAILIALTVHELAHGFVAKYYGDRTAEEAGRLTLNPLAHLDILGTIMLFFGPFGWAKPVPVNPLFFEDPRRDMAYVAVAGPLSNIFLAALSGLFLRLGIVAPESPFAAFLYISFMINIGLAVFNLLPVYPLDGSRILMAFLNNDQSHAYLKVMRVVPLMFLGMITAEWAFNIPVMSFLLNPIFDPAFKLARSVFIGN